MQTPTRHASFSAAQPWLPGADDFIHENVANLAADTKSILALYKALIALRKKLPPLVSGDYIPLAAQGGSPCLTGARARAKWSRLRFNLGAEPNCRLRRTLSEVRGILLSTLPLDREGEKLNGRLDLAWQPEGVIIGASSSV